jgi:thiol-disulfide isomerase/thioredoxin
MSHEMGTYLRKKFRHNGTALALLALLTGGHCAKARVSAQQDHAPPIPAPRLAAALRGDLPVTTWSGQPVALQSLSAPVTVLALWSSDCPSCLQQLPYLEALHQRSRKDGVSVILVNTDSKEHLAAAKAQAAPLKLSLPVVTDDQYAVRCRLRQVFGAEFLSHSQARAEQLDKVPVPLLAILGADAPVWGETASPSSQRQDDFVSAKLDLIALAKRGEIPEKKPVLRPLQEAVVDPGLQFQFSAMTPEQIERELPRIEKLITNAYPRLDADGRQKLLEQAAQAMRRGGKVLLIP